MLEDEMVKTNKKCQGKRNCNKKTRIKSIRKKLEDEVIKKNFNSKIYKTNSN
jgi:hypothetical protein